MFGFIGEEQKYCMNENSDLIKFIPKACSKNLEKILKAVREPSMTHREKRFQAQK